MRKGDETTPEPVKSAADVDFDVPSRREKVLESATSRLKLENSASTTNPEGAKTSRTHKLVEAVVSSPVVTYIGMAVKDDPMLAEKDEVVAPCAARSHMLKAHDSETLPSAPLKELTYPTEDASL